MSPSLTWHDVIGQEKEQPYFKDTLAYVAAERRAGKTIYPPQKDIFNAFRLTELESSKSRHSGARSVSRPQPGSWIIIFGSTWCSCPPFIGEYIQGTGH